jgi:methylphosphotriester-DNA--protein-cysteine methyltransferase
MIDMDDDACYRAIETRDHRFDGRLFVGVISTGIDGRPFCPAPPPNEPTSAASPPPPRRGKPASAHA